MHACDLGCFFKRVYFIKIDYIIESAPYGFLFTSRKNLETHSFATLTRSFLKLCNE